MNQRWPDGSARLPLTQCPRCGKKLDAASTLDGLAPLPQPNDIMVCFACGGALKYDDHMGLQTMTLAELSALSPDEAADLRQVQTTIRSMP